MGAHKHILGINDSLHELRFNLLLEVRNFDMLIENPRSAPRLVSTHHYPS